VEHQNDLFLSIAEIAGIFIGFGALISFSSDRGPASRVGLRNVVAIGLLVLVAAVVPVGLSHYGLTGRALWGWSSGAFLLFIWTTILGVHRDREHREWAKADAKANPALAILFWVFLEVPIQVPLALAILGVAPSLASAFYVTALVLNLFQAAFVLARLVFAREPGPGS
jgi:hypothetical protein